MSNEKEFAKESGAKFPEVLNLESYYNAYATIQDAFSASAVKRSIYDLSKLLDNFSNEAGRAHHFKGNHQKELLFALNNACADHYNGQHR